ncbi:MAG: ABC transporter permease [Candidatus Rokubacteria bacterium]|nr:ABC transporter permease [Candidatus Rokubacteria bacterium]
MKVEAEVRAVARAAARPAAAHERWPVRVLLHNVLAALAVLAVWQAATWLVHSVFFPSPLQVWRAMGDLWVNGDVTGNSLLTHIRWSLFRLLAGFSMGVVLGVPLGLLMGLYKPLYIGTRAALEPFRFIPPIAWIPLTIVLLSGFSRYVFLIWLGAFFPIFVATLVGVPRVDLIHKNVAKVHGAGRWYILTRVVIPSVLPDILGGMRVGMGTAWMTIVAAEMSGGETTGIGRMMVNYAELLRIPEIVVGMILIGVLGLLMNEVLIRIEKRLFRWRWEVSL